MFQSTIVQWLRNSFKSAKEMVEEREREREMESEKRRERERRQMFLGLEIGLECNKWG